MLWLSAIVVLLTSVDLLSTDESGARGGRLRYRLMPRALLRHFYLRDLAEQQPSFSSDGNLIVYSDSNTSDTSSIATIRPDGTGRQIVTSDPDQYDEFPAFSPDGREIVFTRSRGDTDTQEIWKVNTNGSGLRQLTTTPSEAYSSEPSWSADGRLIVFYRYNGPGKERCEVWTMNAADGSNQRRVIGLGGSPSFRQANRSADNEALLRRYIPFLKYDSENNFFFDSAAEATDNPRRSDKDDDYGNTPKNPDSEIIAAATPPNPPGLIQPLSMSFLVPGPGMYPGGFYPITENDFIDERGDDLCTYWEDAVRMRYKEGYGNHIYGRVKVDPDDNTVWLQCWLYAYYNDHDVAGVGVHEGDSEMIQVAIGPDNRTPEKTTYTQHRTGDRCPWVLVEKVGSAPVVYVARGSHALFYAAGFYFRPPRASR